MRARGRLSQVEVFAPRRESSPWRRPTLPAMWTARGRRRALGGDGSVRLGSSRPRRRAVCTWTWETLAMPHQQRAGPCRGRPFA